MADNAHAMLSASGAPKWLICTPSARLEASINEENPVEAAEGTKAHKLLEYVLREYYFFEDIPADLQTAEGRKAAGFDESMMEACQAFLEHCKAITDPLDASGTPFTVLIEHKLAYDEWVPEGFGTGDFIVVSKHCLWVRDFKYGAGVAVSAGVVADEGEENDADDGNKQMMLYGLGAWNELGMAYDEIRELDIGIVQPRINRESSWRITLDNLLGWAELIKPIAVKAFAGEGEFVPGPHCTKAFCRARFTCRARAVSIMDKVRGMPDVALLSPEEIGELYPFLTGIASWANRLKEFAQGEALANGASPFPQLKLVEGKSNRFISDKNLARARLVANGFPLEKIEVVKDPELLGITALEKLCGKKKFVELLSDVIVKPAGKPTLVSVDDPRPRWMPRSDADSDFNED